MLLGKLKDHFLHNKLLKRVKELSDSKTPNSRKINSVAILTTDELSSQIDLSKLIKNELTDVRHVHIYSFRKFKKSDSITYKHFTKRDFNWSWKIKEPSFESFIENPFDLLISYFNQKNLYLEYVTLQSNAAFKVGFSNVNDKMFDLIIKSNEKNAVEFISEVSKYLAILNKI